MTDRVAPLWQPVSIPRRRRLFALVPRSGATDLQSDRGRRCRGTGCARRSSTPRASVPSCSPSSRATRGVRLLVRCDLQPTVDLHDFARRVGVEEVDYRHRWSNERPVAAGAQTCKRSRGTVLPLSRSRIATSSSATPAPNHACGARTRHSARARTAGRDQSSLPTRARVPVSHASPTRRIESARRAGRSFLRRSRVPRTRRS